MITKLTVVGLMVHDQEEALRFYTEKLGFEKRTDQSFGPGWRWVTIAPKGQTEIEITLMKPDSTMVGEEKAKVLMDQVGMAPTWSYTVEVERKKFGRVCRMHSRTV